MNTKLVLLGGILMFSTIILNNKVNAKAQVTAQKLINAPVEAVFASWNDEFGDVYKYHPALKYSFLLDDSKVSSGKGAKRQCNMKDGKNWVQEEIVDFEENKLIVISVYKGTTPMKYVLATINFHEEAQNQTGIKIKMEFEPKMGILGQLMIPLMKMQFQSMLNDLLKANAAYIKNGTLVNEVRTPLTK
ncbi:MAG: SRPBCC family protein [Candidatus Caenarcaniphilales bacterium]|nr:SRPBCC family protein [Candidatus Caenarcaniphilales bacterium]